MKLPYLLTFMLVTVVLAGCLGDEEAPAPEVEETVETEAPTPPPAPDFDFSTAIDVTHGGLGAAAHEIPDMHEGGFGLEKLDFYDLSGGTRYQAIITGQYNEVDTCDELAIVSSFAGNRGFTLVNVTNTSDMTAFAQFPTASTNWDARFSPDCQTVFVGMELGVVPSEVPMAPPLPPTGVSLTGLADAGRGGVIMVDISDVRSLQREHYADVGSVHNLFTAEVDGETYVITNTGHILKVVGEVGSRSLEKVAEIPGSHDVHVERHPVTNHPYLFTGNEALSIYDFQDPAAPELLASMEFPEGYTAWHEQTPAPAMLDGRWILIGAGECQCGVPGNYAVVNITDPTEPGFLGGWILPGDFSEHNEDSAFYTFSAHNVAIRADGRAALANYHAGTWVIDVSTKERQENPVTLGYDLPNELAEGIVRSLPYAPYVWGGAWAHDGSLLIADLNTGLHSYKVE